jgi:hypothetical protein
MPIKISQLTELTVIDGTVVVPVVDTSGPTPVSKKSTVANISSHILSGNAATATKLATARNINGIAFDGTQDITITTSLAAATSSTIGGVIVGNNLTVAVDGTIAVDTSTIATKTYVDNTSTDNAISFSVALG